MWTRRQFTTAVASTLALGAIGRNAQAAPDRQSSLFRESVTVDLRHDIGPLEHIWSRCAGSDRAEITMRAGWLSDAKRMHDETGLQRVRFHGILDDEMGVWPDSYFTTSKPPNFQLVDIVYDNILDLGMQPWVELSFMPGKLASGKQTFGFYQGNITPPKSLPDWTDFINQFVRHLVRRYGAKEVRQWYFEVWNEPNLPFFWTGSQAQYFDFYRATAAAVKKVDSALKVGGPATSAVQWIPEFLDYCYRTKAPLDFVSTHLYPGDNQEKVFGQKRKYSQANVVAAGMAQVRAQIDATTYKGSELWLSEWSSDSPAIIARTIAHCLPGCYGMSHWELSGVYEEITVPPWIIKEGDAGFGLFAARNIPRPGFNTYKLLNRLGDRKLGTEGPVLASRLANGASAAIVWNLANVEETGGIPGINRTRKVSGEPKMLDVALKGAKAGQKVRVSYVDQERGSPLPAWRALGSPQYMTRSQLDEVRASAELGDPEVHTLGENGEIALELPPEGIALLELDA